MSEFTKYFEKSQKISRTGEIMMKILIQTEDKTYSIKKSVIETLAGLGFLLTFILLVSWLQNLAIAWGVATW